MHFETLLFVMLPLAGGVAGMYSKGSPVLQIDARTYDRLIAQSNYSSIVEFYAPWCGHCKNLKPAYEKAAGAVAGLAKVAAIDCDEDANKQFCGSMGVQGFPTLKIVKPSKKAGGKPVVEDYQGARTAKAIADAVLDRMPNHVSRVKDDGLDAWLGAREGMHKALFFSDKGTVGAMVKALAVDFLGAVDFAQLRSSEKTAAAKYGVTTFPAVVLLPASDASPITYDGTMKKAPLVKFLSQVAAPNPDPPIAKAKSSASAKKDKPKASKASVKRPAPPAETLEANGNPLDSSDPDQVPESPAPVVLPVKVAPKIASLDTAEALQKSCLHRKASTCILALLPPGIGQGSDGEGDASIAPAEVQSLSEIAHKHTQRGAKMFPFYSIPSSNVGGIALADSLKLDGEEGAVKIVAVNAKRGWWKAYAGQDVSGQAIERWIDAIRFDEITKEKMPEGLVVELQEELPKQQPLKVNVVDDDGKELPIAVEVLEVMDDDNDDDVGHDEL